MANAVAGNVVQVGPGVYSGPSTGNGTTPVFAPSGNGSPSAPLIFFAQVVNGLVLPIVAVVLLVAMNDRARLGANVNTWRGNLVGGTVALLCLVLGLRAIAIAL